MIFILCFFNLIITLFDEGDCFRWYNAHESPFTKISTNRFKIAISNSAIVSVQNISNHNIKVNLYTPDLKSVQRDVDNTEHLLLVDFTVRNINQISNILSAPRLQQFKRKLAFANEQLDGNKFCYSHDVGEDRIQSYSIARIPLETYQKLILSRKIADQHTSPNQMIHLLTFDGYQTDVDDIMINCIMSAFQMNRFQMPNFKTTALNQTHDNDLTITIFNPVNETTLDFIFNEINSQFNVFYDQNDEKRFPQPPKKKTFQSIQSDLKSVVVVNQGTNLARALSSLPPNYLNPKSYVTMLQDMATDHRWEYTEWSAEELRDYGCGAFYAVVQANTMGGEVDPSDRLVRLKWFPTKKSTQTPSNILGSVQTTERPIVLVGKGVCYDTGGLNLKSANSMKTMKLDMTGSSVALGVFYALTTTECEYPVECWLLIVENNIGPKSFRPDDVIHAVTGDSIEIVNTDAEGRLLLADVLALATRKKIILPSIDRKDGEPKGIHSETDKVSPKLLIDFATLTGTCILSLSDRYIGAFTNKKELIGDIIQAGYDSGERVWPFPLDSDYEDDLKSDLADILQCRQPTTADHIYAAIFLQKFVNPSVPWIHLDLGSAYRPGGLGHIPSDYTGIGVRLAIEIINSFLL